MKEKLSFFALISVGIMSSVVLIFAFAEYVLPVIMPFLIAILIAALTVSPARKLSERIKAPERVIRLILSVLIMLTFFLAMALLVWQLSSSLWRFLADVDGGSRLYEMLSALFSADVPLLGNLPPELALRISETVGEIVSSGLSMIAEGVASIVTALPQTFFFLLVTLISLVYFALDYEKIKDFLLSVLPSRATETIKRMRDGIISVMKKYLFSYSIIMLITYGVILAGLWLLGVKHAPVISLFIALLDILPVIGVGTVLLPWSVIELLMGHRFLGIGLILLFVVNAVIRQLSEPKIVGKSLDLHPIATLIMIYVGYALFGFVGMIVLPVVAVGVFTVLKRDNSAEIA